VPDAVKFDSRGRIVSTQIHSGQVLRIDPQTGAKEVLANIGPGLDNLVFKGERLFVSSAAGAVHEVLDGGRVRELAPDGFNWPLGLAVSDDGVVHVADGLAVYTVRPGQPRETAGSLFGEGAPGYARGVAWSGPGEVVVATGQGAVARWNLAAATHEILAEGFDQLYGVAVGPGGAIVAAEMGAGRVLSLADGRVEVLASGLDQPMGVAIAEDGTCLVSEAGAGRIVKLSGGRTETVLDGLQKPHGIAVRGGRLYVVDALAKDLIEYDMDSGARRVIATGLPVGAPPGVTPKRLGPVGVMVGPLGPFTGLAAGSDGTLYVSADAEGSVLALRPAL